MESLKEERERLIRAEQLGIKNSKDIIEVNHRTKSNTHRIDKIEKVIEDIKKDTSSLGEIGAILKVQTEINFNQAKHMEKLDEMLGATTQNLTELKFMAQRLDEKHESTEKNLEKLQDKFEKESEEGKISSNKIVMTIVLGLVAGIPSLILAWIKIKGGL